MTEKNVVVYSTTTCPWCHRTKEYLAQKGVKFTEYNVSNDREKAQEMIQKSGQMGVPVITIDNNVIIGFNQPELDKLLA
jgi:glutaredoxin-like YruB-family protein